MLTKLSKRQKILLGINLAIALYFVLKRLYVVKTCGGLINPWLFIQGILCLAVPFFVIYSVVTIRSQTRIGVALLLLNLCFLLLIFYPSTETYAKLGFMIQKPLSDPATRQILERDPVTTKNLTIPEGIIATCGGEIVYRASKDTQYIFYYTEVDWLSFSGYLYSTDNTLPSGNIFHINFDGTSKDICSQISNHWFFCSFED